MVAIHRIFRWMASKRLNAGFLGFFKKVPQHSAELEDNILGTQRRLPTEVIMSLLLLPAMLGMASGSTLQGLPVLLFGLCGIVALRRNMRKT
jgi:hypothetical protein